VQSVLESSRDEDAPRHEYWIKVLIEDKVGWVKSTYLNIDWVDPDEYA
jgi:hypothetical protein